MWNKRKNFVLLITAAVFFVQCATTSRGLKEPGKKYSYLVIGSVTVDLFHCYGITATVRYGIEVAIVGKVLVKGVPQFQRYWVTTDDRGYFALANVPPGKYALKGFRVPVLGNIQITVINELKNARSKFKVQRSPYIPARVNYFKYPKAKQRIVNLRHNYFLIDSDNLVYHREFFRIQKFRTVTGEILDEPSVIDYFIQRNPHSGWLKFLEKNR